MSSVEPNIEVKLNQMVMAGMDLSLVRGRSHPKEYGSDYYEGWWQAVYDGGDASTWIDAGRHIMLVEFEVDEVGRARTYVAKKPALILERT
jgi:hypothetical protein